MLSLLSRALEYINKTEVLLDKLFIFFRNTKDRISILIRKTVLENSPPPPPKKIQNKKQKEKASGLGFGMFVPKEGRIKFSM